MIRKMPKRELCGQVQLHGNVGSCALFGWSGMRGGDTGGIKGGWLEGLLTMDKHSSPSVVLCGHQRTFRPGVAGLGGLGREGR